MPKVSSLTSVYLSLSLPCWPRFCSGVFLALACLIQNVAQAQTSGYVLATNALAEGANGGSDSVALIASSSAGTWAVTGSLNVARYYHTATLLTNGLVVVAGGENSSGVLSDTELYNPGTGVWTTVSPLNTARFDFTATLLPNGTVLVAGGRDGANLTSAELSNFSLTNMTGWTNTGSMSTPRRHPVASLLPNGLLMESGGYSTFYLASAELYNWATGTWTNTGPMNAARTFQGVALLPSGLLLVAGGQSVDPLTIASAEVYNPTTGIWTNTASLNAAREYHTLTLLPNGLVLAAAGWDGNTDTALSSAELYNPATGTWTNAVALNNARLNHTATLLSNGLVLAAAGADSSGSLTTAELYNSVTGAWSETGSLNTARAIHTATMLTNGSVLVVGGADSSGNALASAEVYSTEPGPWTATANVPWLHLTPANQSGTSGTNVVFSFDPNPGATRTGSLTIAGQTLTITQAGTTYYALGATVRLEGPTAGVDSVVLALNPNSGFWTATANATWLHLSSANQSGMGSTNVVFSYDANPGAIRIGTLTVGGQTLTVTQAGATYVNAGALTSLVDLGQHIPYSLAVDSAGDVDFADSDNDAILTWMADKDTVSLLNFDVLEFPQAVAVDGAGNVYFADSNDGAINEWTVSGIFLSLRSGGLSSPAGLAVDGAGNVYIADTFNNAIKEWMATNNDVITLVSNGLSEPYGVAVDIAGNVYIADTGNNAIKVWTAANNNVTTLVSGLNAPQGVAVDGAGNVYIADSDNSVIKEWTAASSTVTALASLGSSDPSDVAVDVTGNVYFAQTGNNAIKELPYAYVDPTPKLEGLAAGNDALPAVLPAAENLTGPFAPASDQSWLTITGITNGIVSFSFAADAGPNRTANITLLGQKIPITQGSVGPLVALPNLQTRGNGVVHFVFSNAMSSSFTVLSTTNLALPWSDWTVVGTASNTAPGQFEFTSQPTTNDAQRFYGVRSP